MNNQRCRLCALELREALKPVSADSDLFRAHCNRCGKYEIAESAYEDLPTSLDEDSQFWLRAATRQHWESTSKLLCLTTRNLGSLAAEHSSTSVAGNLDKLLSYLVRKSPRPGARIRIEQENDYTVIDAKGEAELLYYIRHLEEIGFIKKAGADCELTVKGWDHVLGTSASSAEFGRVFVATWFDPKIDEPYRDGIKAALEDAGYRPVWMKDELTNEDINFRILVEIRKAQFVVADITGARAGVYFEAGFAKGLGREVFFTCEEASFARDKHFDTEHFQHVMWQTPLDLRKRLYEKVFAVMGAGPHLPSS